MTGAASGLGLAATVGFAALGASVRLLARNQARATEGALWAGRRAGGGDIRPVACDLSDRTELTEFIRRFSGDEDRLDVLVNNAGVMPDEREHTRDGLELTFATQVLAPWMLIPGLRPLLAVGLAAAGVAAIQRRRILDERAPA